MRLAIIGCCLCWPLLLLVPGGSEKPVLYVVESDSCPPCRAFQNAWTNTPGFADLLRSRYDVKGLHWENDQQRARAQQMGVTALPSFVIFSRDGRRLGMIEGYSTEYALLTDLRLPPLTRPISQQRTQPQPSAQSRDSAATPRGFSTDRKANNQGTDVPRSPESPRATADEAARREIQRLEQSMQSLQRQLRDVGKAPESSQELQSLRRTVEELKAAAAKSAAAAGSQLQNSLPVTPILTPEAPPSSTSGLFALALKVGTTLLLPEVAIPTGAISIAATVGGWWLGRRRRNQRQRIPDQSQDSASSGSEQNSVTVLRDSTTRQNTANHFIVKETDRVGEAYKEAIRRITAAYKSDKPGIVDVASQIEHVAQEILRGQNVTSRASTAPRPGIWTDED
jgi:hypothetical protein